MQERAIIYNEEAELFKHYELKGWQFSPRVYQILAVSTVINLFLFYGMAKANFLTAKSCDTAIMSSVCSVLDTLYVGSEILSADGEFVSKDYDKTELSEDDEIIMVDMTGEYPPLVYPEGYFALANPEQAMMSNDPNALFPPTTTDVPGMTTSPTTNGTDLLNTPQVLPQQNNNVIDGDLPSNPLGTTVPKIKKYPTSKPPKTKPLKNEPPKTLDTNTDTTADKDKPNQDKEPKSDPVKDVEINKKPFEDLGDSVNAKLENKEIDLNQPFLIVMSGSIMEDGKFDRAKSKYTKLEGDEKMVNTAKDAVEALGDSGFLGYLKKIGVDKVTFTLVQDDKQISAVIVSEQKSPEKAKTTASAFSTMLTLLKTTNLDENSKPLIENSKVTSEGKNFVLNFAIPKQDAQALINRSLKERADKKANPPNTKTETNSSNTNAQIAK